MSFVPRPRHAALCASAFALCAVMAAQATPAGEPVFTLGTISVTGSRTPLGALPLEQVGSTITLTELLKFGRETVGDAVNLLPGVTISNNQRNELLVFLRGYDARQVPLFIDGVPVYVPYDGFVDFNRFSTYDVAAVQVAKGFSSIAYGPNALGGAINVVTRRPQRALEGDAFLGLGSGSDQQAGLNIGLRPGASAEGGPGPWYAQLGLSWRDAKGFRMSRDFRPTPTEDGGLRNNSDRRDAKLSFKLGYTPRGSDEYAIAYNRQDGRKGQPPTVGNTGVRYWRWPYWDKESLYFTSSTALSGTETLKARVYTDRFDNEVTSYTDATYTRLRTSGMGSVATGRSIYNDRTHGAGLELESRRLAGHVLRLVWQQRKDEHVELDANAVRGALYQDTLRSFGLEDMITLAPAWQLSLGAARHELRPDTVFSASSAYSLPAPSRATNLQAGLFHDLSSGSRVYATLARKTRLPTLRDRYSQRLGSYIENPNLGPERSTNLELGFLGQVLKGLDLEAALFRSDADDRIQAVFVAGGTSCSAATRCQVRNVGRTRVTGLELGVRATPLAGLELGGNLTMMQQKNLVSPEVRALGVPDRKLFAYARWQPAAGWSLQATAEHNSARWASNTVSVPGHTVAGLRLGWEPTPGWQLSAAVDNLADRNYELDAGYPAAGRQFSARVRHAF